MPATSAHHIVRVTVRIDVDTLHRDIDLTLPTSSSMAEIIPEIARLVDLPEIPRPWEATTVAGEVLDTSRPLYQLRIHDGTIITLRPKEPSAPPIVRDAAESLVATSEETGNTRGLHVAASLCGAVMLMAVTRPAFGTLTALTVSAAALIILSALSRTQTLYIAGIVVAGVATGLWVGPAGALAAGLTVLVGALLGAVLSLIDARVTAFLTTTAVLICAGAAAEWLPSPSAPVAMVVVAGLIAVMLAPAAAIRAAGLAIPHVPTAGEDLQFADSYQPDVDNRSRAARRINDGIACGIAACCIPALLWLGRTGGGWVVAFALCTCAALVIHAFRHHAAVPRASYALTALAAAVSSALAVRVVGTHPALIVVAFLSATLTLTAVLWAPRLPDVEPTTRVWFERAEFIAIIAVFPIGLHLAGLFTMIRGA